MAIGNEVTNRIWTIPNIVSMVRLLGIPVFWWILLVEDNVGLAAAFFLLIGWTDWIDGYLARRLNQVSRLGKALDPVADRLLIASAVIGGLIAEVVPPIVGWGLLVREVFVGWVAWRLWRKGGGTLEVRYYGKVATFLIYGAIPAFYLAAAPFLEMILLPVAWIASVAGTALYWWVGMQYAGDARAQIAELESSE